MLENDIASSTIDMSTADGSEVREQEIFTSQNYSNQKRVIDTLEENDDLLSRQDS